jgi:enoyl-CoA hydratase/carnithine racemase
MGGMRAEVTDGILNIILDSPHTKNAFGLSEAKQLSQSLKGDIRLIVLSAQGRVFCSGGNLHEYRKLKTKAAGVKINRDIRVALKKLSNFPAPKIAIVTGDCFGGGIELLSCFDFILSEPHAFFGMWQRRQELSFGWGGYERLKKRMSDSELQTWLLTGELKSAISCKNLGLVNEIIPNEQMSIRLKTLTNNLLSFKNESYIEIKNGLERNETLLFEKLWWSSSHREKLRKS